MDGGALRHHPLVLLLPVPQAHIYKISGSDLDDPVFSARFAQGIAAVSRDAPTIVVHGGGKELSELLGLLNIESRFVDGLRVTPAPARDAAMMVFAGLANKRLVAAMLVAGADAIGLSGVDGGLVRVARISDELGFVGKPVQIRADLVRTLLSIGLVPVLNPICLGLTDFEIYNVNADHVAGAMATALDAAMLTFVTNVPGVMNTAKQMLNTLTHGQADALIADGTISGGMIPKVRTALAVLSSGVPRVRICDLAGLAAGGTVFLP